MAEKELFRGTPPFRKMCDNDWKDLGVGPKFMFETFGLIPESKKSFMRYAPLDYCPWAHPDEIVVDRYGDFCIVFDD